jgi:predicted Zn-dependent protease
MQKRIIFEGTLLLLIFGAVWGILTIFPIWPQKIVPALTVEKEEKIGNLILKATLTDPAFGESGNDTVIMALETIKNRLLESVQNSDYNYNIKLVSSDIANAFALPGGNILVTDKLVFLMSTPGECAAVLAHEIGHIEKKHTLSKLLTNFTASVLLGDKTLAAEAAQMLATSAYSRRQEESADDFALDLLEKSGINPHIMGTTLRHLKDESGDFSHRMEIIMSHPDMDSRIQKAYEYKVREGFSEKNLEIDWEAVHNSITRQKAL